MKAQCDADGNLAPKLLRRRRLLAGLRAKKGAGNLPVDFKIRGKTPVPFASILS